MINIYIALTGEIRYCRFPLFFTSKMTYTMQGFVLAVRHIFEITSAIVQRIFVKMMGQLASRSAGNKPMHCNTTAISSIVPITVSIPAKVPPDRNPAEATNELELSAVNDCKLALSKQNPTAIETGRAFEFNLKHRQVFSSCRLLRQEHPAAPSHLHRCRKSYR